MKKVKIFLCIIFCYAYIFPIFNYVYTRNNVDSAYEAIDFKNDPSRKVRANGILLPKIKQNYVKALFTPKHNGVIVFGNSTQFHFQRKQFEKYYNCRLPAFFNFSHVGAEPFIISQLFNFYKKEILDAKTVIWAIYPSLFAIGARRAGETSFLPFRDLSLWVRDIRDGNSSIGGLFPRLITITWPGSKNEFFPIINYYKNRSDFGTPDKLNMLYRPDGSVRFHFMEQQLKERLSVNSIIDTENMKRGNAENEKNPVMPLLLKSFEETVELLNSKSIKIFAYEPPFHPVATNIRLQRKKQRETFLRFMRKIANRYPHFRFISDEVLLADISGKYWLDGSHISDSGSFEIVRRLARRIPSEAICEN